MNVMDDCCPVSWLKVLCAAVEDHQLWNQQECR